MTNHLKSSTKQPEEAQPRRDEAPRFTLHWLDGKKEVVSGPTIGDAITKAGYGNGAMRALDFWSVGENDNWYWDKRTGWERKKDTDGGK